MADKLPTNYVKSRYQTWTSSRCHLCTQPETFDHLCLSSCNPNSVNFRANLTTSVDAFFMKTATPVPFAQCFHAAMEAWFHLADASHELHWPGPASLLQAQQLIGWPRMFRGFFAIHWTTFRRHCIQLDRNNAWWEENKTADSNPEEGDTISDANTFTVTFDDTYSPSLPTIKLDPHRYIARLIKLIWDELGTLWRSHLDTIHVTNPDTHNDRHHSLCLQIRALQNFQSQTLADHRNRYFFSNVDNYLQNATISNMQNYIERYRPVILNSIRQATKLATRAPSLLTFPGFTRTTSSTRAIHASQEETQHRKHTKIRHTVAKHITSFFSRNNNHQTTHSP